MALINCPECQKEISDTSKKCVHCGFKLPKPPREKKFLSEKQKRTIVIGGAALMAALLCVVGFLWFFSPKTVTWLCKHKKIAATCTQDEYCSRCGKHFAPATGHMLSDATCVSPMTCNICGYEQGEALGHKWKSATCTEPKTCNVCETVEGEALGHNYRDATCTEAKTCGRCGATDGHALNHNYKDYICRRCGKCVVSSSDMPNIIDINNPKYRINSVGGISQEWSITNKSSKKTINYVYFTLEFYNAVGDVIKNDIGGDKSTTIYYTGPLKPGQSSSTVSWDAIFYNNSFSGTMNFTEIRIEYSDGTTLIIEDGVAKYAVVNWR